MQTFVEFAQSIVYLTLAAVVDVGFVEVVERYGAVWVVVDDGGNIVAEAAAGGVDAYRVGEAGIKSRKLVSLIKSCIDG